MKVFITYDYEIFFGSSTGVYTNTLINPVNKISDILGKYNVKATFFVDSGYLLKLIQLKDKYTSLELEYEEVVAQLMWLKNNGHDIQLHIHPHWEDSFFDGRKWLINTERFSLSCFTESEVVEIFKRYKAVIEDLLEVRVSAYRAGGWCIQPFSNIRHALKECDVKIDSTLFYNGYSQSDTHFFDFRGMPDKTIYKFTNNPVIEDSKGDFIEVPITSIRVSPFFYWKFLMIKKLSGNAHRSYGDGKGIASGSLFSNLRLLCSSSYMAVSLDGYKSSLLRSSFASFCVKYADSDANFVVIGHPKSQSRYSLLKLDDFVNRNREHKFVTYSEEFTCA